MSKKNQPAPETTSFKKGDPVELIPPTDYDDRTPIPCTIVEGPYDQRDSFRGLKPAYTVKFHDRGALKIAFAETLRAVAKPARVPGPQPVGLNWGNGMPAQRCAKCRTLCGPEIIPNKDLGWCEMCLTAVRAAAPDLLIALKQWDTWVATLPVGALEKFEAFCRKQDNWAEAPVPAHTREAIKKAEEK